jgi:hypothetical protein
MRVPGASWTCSVLLGSPCALRKDRWWRTAILQVQVYVFVECDLESWWSSIFIARWAAKGRGAVAPREIYFKKALRC